jgi:hypothetical protein
VRYREITEARITAYPNGPFWLPIEALDYYDDPQSSTGDDGWSFDELLDSIRTEGQQMEVFVGFSVTEIRERQNYQVCVFNGNHRLLACRKLGIKEMLCDNSPADDAEPLTLEQITKLGGRLLP